MNTVDITALFWVANFHFKTEKKTISTTIWPKTYPDISSQGLSPLPQVYPVQLTIHTTFCM